MKIGILDPSGLVELLPWSDDVAGTARAGGQSPPRVDEVSALVLARRFALAPGGTFALRRLLASLLFGAPLGRQGDDAIVRDVATRIHRGELLVLRGPAVRLGSFHDEIEAAPLSEPQAAVPEKPTAWLEIELVEVDGKPVPREPYEVRSPSGTVVRGQLDGNGFARVADLDPGSCTVTFPLRDRRDWEGRSVVVPEGELVVAPPPPRSWIEIELVDEAGAPVADEPFLVLEGDRPVARGRTDERGCARVESLSPGACRVLFPARDARDLDFASP